MCHHPLLRSPPRTLLPLTSEYRTSVLARPSAGPAVRRSKCFNAFSCSPPPPRPFEVSLRCSSSLVTSPLGTFHRWLLILELRCLPPPLGSLRRAAVEHTFSGSQSPPRALSTMAFDVHLLLESPRLSLFTPTSESTTPVPSRPSARRLLSPSGLAAARRL